MLSQSSTTRHPLDTTAKKLRSRATNSPSSVIGLDMRSERGRRFKDIFQSFINELGGNPDALSEADLIAVRQAAGAVLSAEMMQADLMAGRAVNIGEVSRLTNIASRLISRLKARKPVKTGPSLAELLAGSKGSYP